MSSRRDSRIHISERQNDALLEFENFKRKYLLVNKHITKLNSTLSVRVEELNAQVSSLYVENLRLRASEISLHSQLKREKEKVQQVVDSAEVAVGTLMQQLTGFRTSLGVRSNKPGPSSPIVKRKLPPSPVQPPRETTRLVRPPADAITQIRESDEEEDEEDDTPTRLVTTRRPSTSRLPLPKFAIVPPVPPPAHKPSAIPHINLAAGATKRKVKRDSALLTVDHVNEVERPSSPIMRPTSSRRTRRSSSEREDEDHQVEVPKAVGVDVTPMDGQEQRHGENKESERMEAVRTEERSSRINRKGKARELPRDWDRETDAFSNSERDSSEGARDKDKRRFGIKDVTNSPRKTMSEFTEDKPPEAITSALMTPSSTPTPLFDTVTPRPSVSPIASTMSTPATDGGFESGDGTGESMGGRERRTRKSVNYAEPKLNTKMRKPDPPPESVTRPRASAGTATRRRKSIPTPTTIFPSDEEGDADVEGSGSASKWTEGRRRTVHNTVTTDSVPTPRAGETDRPIDTYAIWGSDGRRHSMVV